MSDWNDQYARDAVKARDERIRELEAKLEDTAGRRWTDARASLINGLAWKERAEKAEAEVKRLTFALEMIAVGEIDTDSQTYAANIVRKRFRKGEEAWR